MKNKDKNTFYYKKSQGNIIDILLGYKCIPRNYVNIFGDKYYICEDGQWYQYVKNDKYRPNNAKMMYGNYYIPINKKDRKFDKEIIKL